MSSSVVLGSAISFLITGHFFKDAESAIEIKASLHKVLILQTCFIASVVTFFQFVFREKPEVPPSAVALAPVENLSFANGIKEAWKNKSFVLLTVAFSNFVGLYFSLGSFLSNFFNPFG